MRVWQASQTPGAPDVRGLLGATPRMLAARARGEYKDLSPIRVAGMAAAAAYLISPIDLIPEGLLTVIGLVDDAAVAMWLTGALLDETSRYVEWEQTNVSRRAGS
jgi:uncharacterized membrane protein YkvA (DUF1232 family)